MREDNLFKAGQQHSAGCGEKFSTKRCSDFFLYISLKCSTFTFSPSLALFFHLSSDSGNQIVNLNTCVDKIGRIQIVSSGMVVFTVKLKSKFKPPFPGNRVMDA